MDSEDLVTRSRWLRNPQKEQDTFGKQVAEQATLDEVFNSHSGFLPYQQTQTANT